MQWLISKIVTYICHGILVGVTNSWGPRPNKNGVMLPFGWQFERILWQALRIWHLVDRAVLQCCVNSDSSVSFHPTKSKSVRILVGCVLRPTYFDFVIEVALTDSAGFEYHLRREYVLRSQNGEDRLLASSCLSVRPSVWNNSPPSVRIFKKFWNLEDFSKICRENSGPIQIRQE